MKKTVGIVGARGYTGAELIRLIARHPQLELAFVSSRERDGQAVADHVDGYRGGLRYENLAPDEVAGVPNSTPSTAIRQLLVWAPTAFAVTVMVNG